MRVTEVIPVTEAIAPTTTHESQHNDEEADSETDEEYLVYLLAPTGADMMKQQLTNVMTRKTKKRSYHNLLPMHTPSRNLKC